MQHCWQSQIFNYQLNFSFNIFKCFWSESIGANIKKMTGLNMMQYLDMYFKTASIIGSASFDVSLCLIRIHSKILKHITLTNGERGQSFDNISHFGMSWYRQATLPGSRHWFLGHLWPRNVKGQDISNHDMNLILTEYSGFSLTWDTVSCAEDCHKYYGFHLV